MRTGDLISGRYRLEAMLGAGGHGVVWSAFDTMLERTVALKRPHSVQGDAERDVFRREAKHAARVHHQNAISVFDAVDTGECWLVMEYLPSESLDKILASNGPLPPERVARMGMQIAAALYAAHAQDVVHRDVKPGNILVSDGDLAKLTDFGISVWRDVTLTSDGKISGTPAYVAPEVANGLSATTGSDVFSLGATLFAAVEGTPPFGTGDPDAILARARRGKIAKMHRAGPLAAVLSEMLECHTARKRPTADQVRQRLKEIVGGDWEPPQAIAATDRHQHEKPKQTKSSQAQTSSPALPNDSKGASVGPGIAVPPDPERSRLWRRAWVPVAGIGVVAVMAFAITRSADSDPTPDPDEIAQSTTSSASAPSLTTSTTLPSTAPSTPSATSQRQVPPPNSLTRRPTPLSTRPPATPSPTPACQQRLRQQYRVTEGGEVHDAAGTTLGRGEKGDLFRQLDTPVDRPPSMYDRYYGTVNGTTGYFLKRKLEYINTILVCE